MQTVRLGFRLLSLGFKASDLVGNGGKGTRMTMWIIQELL